MEATVRRLLLLLIVLCVTGVGAVALIGHEQASTGLKSTGVPALLKGIPQDGPHLGREQAPVEVLEFIDLKCPACQNTIQQDTKAWIDRYVRPGRVQWTLAPIALLGKDSIPPTLEAYQASQSDKMFQYVLGYYSGDEAQAIRLSGLRLGSNFSAGALRDFRAASRLAKQWKVEATPTVFIHKPSGWLRLKKNHFSLADIESAIKG